LAVRRYGFWKEVKEIRLSRNPDPSRPRWNRLYLPGLGLYQFTEPGVYEFTDLQNLNKPYILLFRYHPQGPVDFIQLKNVVPGDGLPTYLAVVVDEVGDFTSVLIDLPNILDSSRKFWGQSTTDPTLDSDEDGVLDVIEEVEEFIERGGFG